MVINSSGTMADCCLIMHQDIIILPGTIMLHYISSLHHIKKLRILPTRALVSWTSPASLNSNVQNPQSQPQRVTVVVRGEDRVETKENRSGNRGH